MTTEEKVKSEVGISGYTVIKHSWRGRYRRLMSITKHSISTYNPTSLELTNSWEYKEVAGVSLLLKDGPNFFNLFVPKEKGKTPSNMKFESIYAKDIVTDIFTRYRHLKIFNESMHQAFAGYKLCRNGSNIPVSMYCTPCGLEIWSNVMKKCIANFFYNDIISLHNISDIVGCFAIQTKYDARKHAFGALNIQEIINAIIDKAYSQMGINLKLADPITVNEYTFTRLGRLGSDEALLMYTTYHVNKLTKRFPQSVPRILGVSELALVEHDPSTYSVVTVRSLKRIYSFVRDLDNPQLFGIEWINGWRRISYYTCPDRDSLLATFLDAVRVSGNINANIHSMPTNFDKRYAPLVSYVDEDTEIMSMKLLTATEAKSFENIVKFNTNIPYSGFQHAHAPDSLFGEKKEKVILSAINSLLQFEQDFSKLNIVQIEHIFQSLKRLFSSKAGFDSFTMIPKLTERLGSIIISGLKKGDPCITHAAIEVMNSLIIPLHPNADLYYEQQNKLSLLAEKKFIKALLDALKIHILRGTGALVISSLLDFLTFIICLPFSETTDQLQFDTVTQLISDVGYPLFRLFQHPSPSIVKSAGMLMKSIIEEASPEICENIQTLALSEGVFPKHLLVALFTQTTNNNSENARLIVNRQLSRKLLTLWLRGSPYTLMLMKRSLPPGIVSFLYSEEKATESALTLSEDRSEVKLEIANKKEIDVFIRKTFEKMEGFFQHWHTRIAERVPIIKKPEIVEAKVAVLREPKVILPLEENWDLFYQKFYQDHYLPDLIWNHKTREELKDSLEAEIRAFNIDKDIGGQVRISWNFDDFEVQYPSLLLEITIGEYYIKPLLDQENFQLLQPSTFFTDLYHVYLQSKTLEMKYSCLKAMAKIYRNYHEVIGKFNDVPYIVHLLKKSQHAKERDLLLQFIYELVLNKDNVRKIITHDLIVHILDLANLSHLHTTRATVPLQTLMLEGPYEPSSYFTNEWYFDEGGKQSDPVSIDEIRKMFASHQITENTKVWAQGMEGWKPIIEITQLKWTVVATEDAILNESDLAVLILDILVRIVSYFPSTDASGGIIRPVPRAKRLLSDVRSLPHLTQLLLTFYPQIVERVTVLLEDTMKENPVLPQLFITGFYFFLMMYTGSNVAPIAKFLKYTHLKQGFRCEADKTRNTLLASSILSPILPEAMIAFLESYDYQKFAEIYLGEFDNPEVIWSKEMRRYMMEKISLHLADFTPRLRSNIQSVFMYCPIPHIEYEQLKTELFCGKYYLRNLCDTTRFPKWPITDPVQTLRDILDAWKEEVNKKPPPMSVDEAYTTLELEVGTRHEDSVVRRAYYKLAMKYHPDRNPDGRTKFEEVVSAYEFLCSKLVKQTAPSNYNIILILKSQSILFVNNKKELEPYKYPGYPMLIKTIKLEIEDQDLFSKNISDVLLLPAVELAHHTIACSSLNAEELRRENGIVVLQTVFERCIPLITSQSKATDMNVLVIQNVIKCFIASTRFDGFIAAIIDLPEILVHFNHILMHHDNLTPLCSVTMECIMSLCCSNLVQMKLLNSGLLYHMVYYIFFYDYTLAEAGIEVSHESNQQQQFNEMAKLAFQGLGIMSVSGNEDINNIPINQILNILLTDYIVIKMTSSSAANVLKLLNSNVENPYLIWNNSTRDQLKDLLQVIRKYNPDKEVENHQLALNFTFDEHKDELVIGGVFVRIYNKMPTYKIENPKEFAVQLISFIKDKSQYISSFIQSNGGELSPVIIKFCHSAFTALFNLLSNSLVFSSIQQTDWVAIFSFFMYKNCFDIQREVLKVLCISSTDIQSVNAIASSNILGFLNLALENLPEDREITLSILQPLFSNSSIVKEAVMKGTLLYLLFIFFFDKEINVRNIIVELFARLLSDLLTGPRVKILLLKFFPSIFIDAILDDLKAAVLLFESKQENPELTWNDETRLSIGATIEKIKKDLFVIQSTDPQALWKISDDFTCFGTAEEGIMVAGVNLKRFIAQPSWVLRHPRDFLVGILDKLVSLYQSDDETQTETLETVSTAFCLFLEAQPAMADQITTLGHLPEIVISLEKSKEGSPIVKSTLSVLKAVLANKSCLIELQKTDRWLQALVCGFSKRPDACQFAAEALHRASDHNSSVFASQALHSGCIPKLLDLLSNSFSETPEPSSTRAHIVSALQSLSKDQLYGVEITQVLSRSSIWRDYKNQKHDLFIENPNSILRIGAAPSGVAGYLTAAHNAAPTSLTNANTLRMLTSSLPPPRQS